MAKKGAREKIKLKSTESAECYWTKKNKRNTTERLELKKYDKTLKKHVAASFQEAVFSDVIKKTLKAAQLHGCKDIYLGGGVTSSCKLKQMFKEAAQENFNFFYPQKGLSLDNGAMIAGLGYHVFKTKQHSDPLDLEALPRLPL